MRIEKCKWTERIQCLSNGNDDYDDNENNKCMFRSVPFEWLAGGVQPPHSCTSTFTPIANEDDEKKPRRSVRISHNYHHSRPRHRLRFANRRDRTSSSLFFLLLLASVIEFWIEKNANRSEVFDKEVTIVRQNFQSLHEKSFRNEKSDGHYLVKWFRVNASTDRLIFNGLLLTWFWLCICSVYRFSPQLFRHQFACTRSK